MEVSNIICVKAEGSICLFVYVHVWIQDGQSVMIEVATGGKSGSDESVCIYYHYCSTLNLSCFWC